MGSRRACRPARQCCRCTLGACLCHRHDQANQSASRAAEGSGGSSTCKRAAPPPPATIYAGPLRLSAQEHSSYPSLRSMGYLFVGDNLPPPYKSCKRPRSGARPTSHTPLSSSHGSGPENIHNRQCPLLWNSQRAVEQVGRTHRQALGMLQHCVQITAGSEASPLPTLHDMHSHTLSHPQSPSLPPSALLEGAHIQTCNRSLSD